VCQPQYVFGFPFSDCTRQKQEGRFVTVTSGPAAAVTGVCGSIPDFGEEILLLLIALLLVLSCAVLIASGFHFKNRVVVLTTVAILCYGQLVLIGEIAGLLGQLGNRWFFLSCHVISLGLTFAVWRKYGSPSVAAPFKGLIKEHSNGELRKSVRSDPDLWLLGLAVAFAYFTGACLVLLVPPNTGDSMGTYMARVGQWISRGGFYPWSTGNWAQIGYPINPQLQVLWTVVLWGHDRFAGAVQYVAAIVGMLSIYGLARVLSAPKVQAAFAALTWATLPQILLQSTSTQTDLVFSSLFLSSIYLLCFGLKEQSRQAILVSALALALTAGTKQTLAFILPGIFLGLIGVWFWNSRSVRKLVVLWCVASLCAFLFVGSFTYVQNFHVFGAPFGPADHSTANFTGRAGTDGPGWAKSSAVMGARYLYNSADVTGLPETIADPLHRLKAQAAAPLFDLIRLPVQSKIALMPYAKTWAFDYGWRPMVHEHNAWYGPLAALLLLPCLGFHLYAAIRRRDPYRLTLILGLVSLFFCLSSFRAWGGTEGRYFMSGLTSCWALTYILYRRAGFGAALFRAVIVVTAVLTMGWTTVSNELKPLTGPKAIWHLDRRGRQLAHFKTVASTIRLVDSVVPPSATIGHINFEAAEYLLFGEALQRRVISIFPHPRIHDMQWLSEQDVNAILFCAPSIDDIVLPGFARIGDSEGPGRRRCTLMLDTGAHTDAFASPQVLEALLGGNAAPLDAPLLWVHPSLKRRVGIGPHMILPEWGLDQVSPGESRLWLGHGEKDGLHTTLWSDSARFVLLKANVAAGPARLERVRTVRFTLTSNAGVKQDQVAFTSPETLQLPLRLVEGRNDMDVEVLETPTTRAPHDSRPLLVRLLRLEVDPFLSEQVGPPGRPLLTVDPGVAGRVMLDPRVITPGWPIEADAARSWLWLGSGKEKGFGGGLHALEEVRLKFEFDLRPGPARPEPGRTLEFELKNEKGADVQTRHINGPCRVAFEAFLSEGLNSFALHVVETPTVRIPTDSRPLMVYLGHARLKE
jgi:hypothetical protein